MTPLPNPEHYEEDEFEKRSFWTVLRSKSLKEHKAIWKQSFAEYRESMRETFGRNRKEEPSEPEKDVKISNLLPKKLTQEEIEADRERSEAEMEKAAKEFEEELDSSKDALKDFARERLELMKVALTEFSAGYKEARDYETKRMMEMKEDYNPLGDFVPEFLKEDQEDKENEGSPAGIDKRNSRIKEKQEKI